MCGSFIGSLARGHLVLFWISTISAFVLNCILLLTVDAVSVDEPHSIFGRKELGIPEIT